MRVDLAALQTPLREGLERKPDIFCDESWINQGCLMEEQLAGDTAKHREFWWYDVLQA